MPKPSTNNTPRNGGISEANFPRNTSAGMRIWSGFDRLRGDSEAFESDRPDDFEAAEAELMLLREENARLKAQLHRPSDVGTLIEQLRRLAAESGSEALDDVWSLLSECLVIREGLDQACTEIQAAIGDVKRRLARLAVRIDEAEPDSRSGPASAVDQEIRPWS
ncbi:MAG: hypothetical protein ACLP8S_00655 [Solirubrobacteraceae bacterium]